MMPSLFQKLVRPDVWRMRGYVPGEQPKKDRSPSHRIIKLNTNENPFPPPKPVMQAIMSVSAEMLRRYPEPSAQPVRAAAARAYALSPENILVGNGSDDLLTIVLRTFIQPGDPVAAPDPTYTLYESLVQLQGGVYRSVPWKRWTRENALPITALLETNAKLMFITRPNAPTGHAVSLTDVKRLCTALKSRGVVVLDEAYADFCEDNGLSLLNHHPNLILLRSFSKSFSLAGARIGLGLMHPEIAAQMHKVRDSYNVDQLAQAAGVAALNHPEAYRPAIEFIKHERARISKALQQYGFSVEESQANFLLATAPEHSQDGNTWHHDLKAMGILVRYFGKDPRLKDKLRITIGTTEEMNRFLEAVRQILERR